MWWLYVSPSQKANVEKYEWSNQSAAWNKTVQNDIISPNQFALGTSWIWNEGASKGQRGYGINPSYSPSDPDKAQINNVLADRRLQSINLRLQKVLPLLLKNFVNPSGVQSLEDAKEFVAGMIEGFFVDGAWGTVKGIGEAAYTGAVQSIHGPLAVGV